MEKLEGVRTSCAVNFNSVSLAKEKIRLDSFLSGAVLTDADSPFAKDYMFGTYGAGMYGVRKYLEQIKTYKEVEASAGIAETDIAVTPGDTWISPVITVDNGEEWVKKGITETEPTKRWIEVKFVDISPTKLKVKIREYYALEGGKKAYRDITYSDADELSQNIVSSYLDNIVIKKSPDEGAVFLLPEAKLEEPNSEKQGEQHIYLRYLHQYKNLASVLVMLHSWRSE